MRVCLCSLHCYYLYKVQHGTSHKPHTLPPANNELLGLTSYKNLVLYSDNMLVFEGHYFFPTLPPLTLSVFPLLPTISPPPPPVPVRRQSTVDAGAVDAIMAQMMAEVRTQVHVIG